MATLGRAGLPLSKNKHTSGRPELPGKKKPIYGRPQSAGGSPFKDTGNTRALLAAPPGWTGSDSEWLVYNALTTRLHMTEGYGADFSYQARLTTTGGATGRIELAGLIADFMLPMRRTVLQVLSSYYHYSDPGTITKERTNGASLNAMGYYVVWLDSDDLDHDLMFYVREALELRDHSRMVRGIA